MLSNSSAEATLEVLEEYYRELEGFSLAPLWNVQEEALVPEPTSKAAPYIWRWKRFFRLVGKFMVLVSTCYNRVRDH